MCKKYYNITNQGVDGMKIKNVEKIVKKTFYSV